MPASQFFLMLDRARSVRNKERVLDAWAAKAATVNKEGFEEILAFLDGLDLPPRRPKDVVVNRRPPLKGEAARLAVMGAFRSDTKVHGKRPVKH
jgi:hypothetical protein